MRLLHTTEGHFKEYDNPLRIRYAILSHVWAKEGSLNYPEKNYQDVLEAQRKCQGKGLDVFKQLGSKKIEKACELARRHGFDYIWIDSCCINRDSGTELPEAINSMYKWYSWAKMCYAFLDDVDATEADVAKAVDASSEASEAADNADEAAAQTEGGQVTAKPRQPRAKADTQTLEFRIRNSRWFLRGWTLQELIAPQEVLFCSKTWDILGTKHTLDAEISAVTRIPTAVLRNQKALKDVSIAERMSWAANRECTKIEDEAYCLIGIFHVNMTPKYGEGSHAFMRLQRAIMKSQPDQSILAWGLSIDHSQLPSLSGTQLERSSEVPESAYLLAPTPVHFSDYPKDIQPISSKRLSQCIDRDVENPQFSKTPHGTRTTLPLLTYHPETGPTLRLALLSCMSGDSVIALVLRPGTPTSSQPWPPDDDGGTLSVGALRGPKSTPQSEHDRIQAFAERTTTRWSRDYIRLVTIPITQLREACGKGSLEKQCDRPIYIHDMPQIAVVPESIQAVHNLVSAPRERESGGFTVAYARWTPELLAKAGYKIDEMPTVTNPEGAVPFTLHDSHGGTFVVEFGKCTRCPEGKRAGWLLRVGFQQAIRRAQLAGSGDAEVPARQCAEEHVANWTLRDGIATKTFAMPQQSRTTDVARSLRISLTCVRQQPRGHSPFTSTRPTAAYNYILDIQILTSMPVSTPAIGSSAEDTHITHGPSRFLDPFITPQSSFPSPTGSDFRPPLRHVTTVPPELMNLQVSADVSHGGTQAQGNSDGFGNWRSRDHNRECTARTFPRNGQYQRSIVA